MKFFNLISIISILAVGFNCASALALDVTKKPLNVMELTLGHIRDNRDLYTDNAKRPFAVILGPGESANLCIDKLSVTKITDHLDVKDFEFDGNTTQVNEQYIFFEKEVTEIGLSTQDSKIYDVPISLDMTFKDYLFNYVQFNVRNDNQKPAIVTVAKGVVASVQAIIHQLPTSGNKHLLLVLNVSLQAQILSQIPLSLLRIIILCLQKDVSISHQGGMKLNMMGLKKIYP